MSAKYKERLTRLESVLLLEKKEIELNELRASCSYGIPEVFRPLCWRLLLDYLPTDRSLWPSYLRKQRETYCGFVEDVIVQPGQSCSAPNCSALDDHPLSLSPDSEWKNYFKDNEMLIQIDKDVRRLCPEIEFFQRITSHPHKSAAKVNLSRRIRSDVLQSEVFDNRYSGCCSFMPAQSKVASKEYANDTNEEGVEYHWQVVERILFIYSKLNPGVKYVQGMNEIVGPLYFVFTSDSDEEWSKYAEADTYFCFQLLMSEVKDNFIKTLDSSNCGIEWIMSQFYERMRLCDPELYNHLAIQLAIKPQFYAFRWLSLLLSQEFPLPDVITIWDSLFSSSNRLVFLQWICIAMVEHERNALMNGDFSTCLRLLQNYPEVDAGKLVIMAYDLKNGLYGNSDSLKGEKNSNLKSVLTPTGKIASAFTNAVKSLGKKTC